MGTCRALIRWTFQNSLESFIALLQGLTFLALWSVLSWGAACLIAMDPLWELMNFGILRLSQTLWPQEFGQDFDMLCILVLSVVLITYLTVWYLNESKSWLICNTVTILQCGFPDFLCYAIKWELQNLTQSQDWKGAYWFLNAWVTPAKSLPSNYLAWRETYYLPRQFILIRTVPTGGKFFLIPIQCWYVSRIE